MATEGNSSVLLEDFYTNGSSLNATMLRMLLLVFFNYSELLRYSCVTVNKKHKLYCGQNSDSKQLSDLASNTKIIQLI